MSRAAFAKTSFSSGVLGPRVSRRVDTQHYFNGMSKGENVICLPWGGVEKTPGTIFVQEVRDSSKTARLFDFIFNRRQAYILQFNDSKIRFYKDHGIVIGGGAGTAITAITNASPGVVTSASHGLSNGEIITMSGVDGMEEVNGVEYRVDYLTANTFSLSTVAGVAVNTTSYGVFIPPTATILLLHLNSNFTDSSGTTPHTVTANGNAAISTVKSVFGNGSCLFDGVGDYLSIPDNADFDLSGGTFTIDCWINTLTLAANQVIYQQHTDANNRCILEITSTGAISFTVISAGSTVVSVVSADGAIVINTWFHVALVENANTWLIFINGSLVKTVTDADRCANYTGTPYIGIDYNAAAKPFGGYIEEFRITKGYARYASTIDSSTKLLLHMEGTALIDSSPSIHTTTLNGSVARSTAQNKFGYSSAVFDGVGDFISVADSADFAFGSGDFTIDFWAYFNDVTTTQILCGKRADASALDGFLIDVSGGVVHFVASSNGVSFDIMNAAVGAVATGAWYHIAVSRNGSNFYGFINGVKNNLPTSASAINTNTDLLRIGRDSNAGDFSGYIDEFRVSKGIARWTADFDAPTAAYLDFIPPTHEGYAAALVDGIYEISHDYDDDELFDIQTAQSADIEYLFHPDHPVMKLSRFDDDDWTLEEVDWQDGPYLDENTTATTLDPSGSSGSVTVTASAVTGINTLNGVDRGFLTTDVGRLIHFHTGTAYGWLQITAWTSTTVVTATVIGYNGVIGTALSGNAASTRWALGAWSDTTGYPRTGVFHQGRLWAAATATQPQTGWSSVSEDFENMTAGTDDADAIIFTINSDKVNLINWIASEKRLIVGTSQEIFTVFSGALSEPITPSNIQVDPSTSYGASSVHPEKIGSFLYYMEGDDRRLRELSYTVVSETFNAVNKSILSDHLTSGGVIEMAFQQSPYGILYALRGDGKIGTFTREADQQIEAWTEQVPAGSNALYKSLAVIPVDSYDEAWFVVSRTINGSTKQYVEYSANPRQSEEADLEDQVLMQSALQYDSSPISSVSGLDHLEGETVTALCDGTVVSGVVSSGVLALGASYSVVSVGLPSTSKVKLLPPEAGSAIGSAQGLMKRINEVMVSVYRTVGLKVGEENGNMEELLRDGDGVVLETLQTDDFTVPATIGWSKKSELYFEQSDPLPCTILLVVLFLWVSEK